MKNGRIAPEAQRKKRHDFLRRPLAASVRDAFARKRGETRKEKVYSMLIENGVEKKDIDSFVSIITDNDYLSKGEGK